MMGLQEHAGNRLHVRHQPIRHNGLWFHFDGFLKFFQDLKDCSTGSTRHDSQS